MGKEVKNTNDNVKKVDDVLDNMKNSFEKVKDGNALAAVTIVAYEENNEIKFAAKDLSKAIGIHVLLCSDMFTKIQASMFQELLLIAKQAVDNEKPEAKNDTANAFQKMINDIKENNPVVNHLFDELKGDVQ